MKENREFRLELFCLIFCIMCLIYDIIIKADTLSLSLMSFCMGYWAGRIFKRTDL